MNGVTSKPANPLHLGRPIRITHCIGTMRLGGAEKQLCELICRLPKSRYEQSLVLVQGGGPLIKRIRAAGCEVVELDYHMKYRAYDPRCYWAMGRTLLRYVRHLREFRPHIVHAQLYWANILSVIAARRAGVPIVITSRLQLSDYKAGRPLLQWIENRMNARTTAIFVNSEAVRRDALRHEKVDPKKLKVIYNGVPLEDFEQIDPTRQRIEFDVRDDQVIVMAVANLHPYKGHDDLLHAVADLVHRFKNLRVLLPGRDQGAREELERLIEKLSLERFVRLIGERQDIAELLSLADIVVHPSHQEGFSNSILEAMTAGKAVIVTKVGGNTEAVANGINGIVVPPRDPEALARALRLLLENPALRHQMGRVSRELIEDEFSMDHMVAQFEEWYDSLVEAHIA